MKIKNYFFISIFLFVVIFSCKKDDDAGLIVVPPRDRTEQQVDDNDSIVSYLQTHYYNSGFFATEPNPSINDIVITELMTGETLPANHTLLITDIETYTEAFEEVDYEYYILRINQGDVTKAMPFKTNDVSVIYKGSLVSDDTDVFDSAVNPTSLDLLGVIEGWRFVFPQFNIATDFTDNGDGTITYNNAGKGVMFLPSGLAYFASGTTGIGAYENLIFKFELYNTFFNDHDGDGIDSHLEDPDGDGDPFNDNTDNDNLFNLIDSDDDGDGVLTINEDLEDEDLTVDSDGDGDPTNDLDGDGDPTNDDSDGDGIPNYLDSDSILSNLD